VLDRDLNAALNLEQLFVKETTACSAGHLHPIFELLGNSWQIVRLVQ
jgi:hypothetical protein